MSEREGGRERERERQRQRQRQRQTDRQTDRRIDRQTDTDKETERHRHRDSESDNGRDRENGWEEVGWGGGLTVRGLPESGMNDVVDEDGNTLQFSSLLRRSFDSAAATDQYIQSI